MKDLIFTKVGFEYVSEPISGASAIHLHINFDIKNSDTVPVHVERTMDADGLGWAEVASRLAKNKYEESIVGIPEGTAIRIRCGVEPVVAKYNEEGGEA